MKIWLKTVIASAALALAAGAAHAADFSGSWARDSAATAAAGYPTYWLVRSEPIGQGGGNQAYVMEVKQQGNMLQVIDPTHPVRTYTLDGRTRNGRDDTMLAPMTQTGTVRDEALTLVSTGSYGGMPGNVSATETQTWALSGGGRILTVSTVRVSPSQRIAFAEVFTRR